MRAAPDLSNLGAEVGSRLCLVVIEKPRVKTGKTFLPQSPDKQLGEMENKAQGEDDPPWKTGNQDETGTVHSLLLTDNEVKGDHFLRFRCSSSIFIIITTDM